MESRQVIAFRDHPWLQLPFWLQHAGGQFGIKAETLKR
jgi:hypothetical protein